MIYKLSYPTKELAIADLITKKVIDTEMNYINGTQAVVYLGVINVTYDVDVMTNDVIAFPNIQLPRSPKHVFAGHENTK